MKQIIGFATQFYTLWDMQTETIYFTDSYGNHWPSREKTNYFFIKNISTDLNKVKELFPNTSIDEGLRGKTSSFSVFGKQEDLSPEILKFGKYHGKPISEVAETDFGYILYLLENGRPETKQVCLALPQVVAYQKKQEADRLAKIASWAEFNSGMHTVTFVSNPNGVQDGGIYDMATETFVLFDTVNGKHYAWCELEDGSTLYVYFNETKYVDGMYPYYMAIIEGKAKRIKGKTFSLNLNVLHTNKNEFGCSHYAVLA